MGSAGAERPPEVLGHEQAAELAGDRNAAHGESGRADVGAKAGELSKLPAVPDANGGSAAACERTSD
jgi:hypothetical protein